MGSNDLKEKLFSASMNSNERGRWKTEKMLLQKKRLRRTLYQQHVLKETIPEYAKRHDFSTQYNTIPYVAKIVKNTVD